MNKTESNENLEAKFRSFICTGLIMENYQTNFYHALATHDHGNTRAESLSHC